MHVLENQVMDVCMYATVRISYRSDFETLEPSYLKEIPENVRLGLGLQGPSSPRWTPWIMTSSTGTAMFEPKCLDESQT